MLPLESFDALIAQIRDATSAEQAAPRVARAEREARSHQNWEALLRALPADEAPRAATLERCRAWALARRDIWGLRVVALFEAEVLHAPDASRRTLEQAAAMLDAVLTEGAADGNVLGFQWRILAEAVSLCGFERAWVQRCLETGWALAWSARSVEQLGRVTVGWASILDRGEAIERFRQVEVASRGWNNHDDVVYWWWAGLELPEEGRRARAEALSEATDFETVSRIIRYWNLYERPSPGLGAALVRAEALAKTPAEGFALAVQAFEHDAALARRALDRAAEGLRLEGPAADARLTAEVAAAYVDRFQDTAASDRVGPRGVRPEHLRPRPQRLEGAESDPAALFDWLRVRIGAELLHRLALGDHGDDVEEHEAALTWICTRGLVPLRLAWHPGEVVRLQRWAYDGSAIEIALSCTLIVLCATDEDLCNTAAPLFHACLELGPDAVRGCEKLLAWCWETGSSESNEAPLILLLLALLRAAWAPDDPEVERRLETMLRCSTVGELRQELADAVQPEAWARLLDEQLPPLRSKPRLAALLEAAGL